MHLAAPLEVARRDERLAEARRTAEVHRQHGIAAVGEPLVVGVEAVVIARPRTAVHHEHHRHGQRRHAVAVRIAARRQREVGRQRQAVARFDLDRMHRLQRRTDELGTRHIQLLQRLGLALVEVDRGGRDHRIDCHGPHLVVFGARSDADVTLQRLAQPLEVRADLRVERGPLITQVGHGVSLDLARARVRHRVADVSAGVLTDDPRAAGRGILGHERRSVTPAAVDPIERLAIGGETDRLRGQRIIETGGGDGLVGHLRAGRGTADGEVVHAACGIGAQREPQRVVGVGHEAGVAIGADDLGEFAGLEVEAMDVMPLRVAVVEADEDAVLDERRDAHDLHARLLERGQRALGARGDVDAIEQEILIARLVLDVHHQRTVGRPEHLADRPIL